MRQLIALAIIGSTLALLLALFGKLGFGQTRDDDLGRSITQWVEKSR